MLPGVVLDQITYSLPTGRTYLYTEQHVACRHQNRGEPVNRDALDPSGRRRPGARTFAGDDSFGFMSD